MTWFNSLGARRLALLAVVFVLGVACAKVDRGYDDVSENGGSHSAGSSGKAGAAMAGSNDAGGEAGSMAEAAGAGGTAGAASVSLTVTLAGDGDGEVTSDPAGIDCGETCGADFEPETEVVLTATPAANSTFAGWSGGGCTGTETCTTTISEVTEVTATFTADPKLIVTLAGNGSGTVKSVPAGIDCGTVCSLQATSGSSIQLTATPAMGSVFSGWSGGGCMGTGACTTSLTAATNVTATFTLTTQTLTVVKAGTGLGTVTSAPMGINCGTDCSEVVNYGTVVTLTAAVTGTGSVFTGWSGGGCSGTGTCVVTVTAATQVTGTFTCSTGTTTLNYTGAIVTYVAPTCVTSLTIEAFGAQGGSSLATAAAVYAGGAGARMKGTFAVTGGPTFKVLVGGKGVDATDTLQQGGGSGGGGTFVTNMANSPFIVAGGGGGAINNNVGGWVAAGLGGSIGTAGLTDSTGTNAGGISGNGGTTDANTGYHSGTGGGGLLGNGVGNSSGSASFASPSTPGLAFVNGGTGGVPGACGTSTPCLVGRPGGFGGGGAAGFTGGGGGGYSGGGAGHTLLSTPGGNGNGGGGGSYNGGTAQSNTAATRIGNGMVVFTY